MARLMRWFKRLLWLGLAGALLGIAGLAVLYWLVAPRLPDVDQLRTVALQEPLSVYSQDGKLMAQFGETRRYPVKIENVPDRVKKAVIAIEDSRFYTHHGLDWRGISRAVWLILTTDRERVPGGSTITQQVARNFYLSTEYSYSRKFMEMLLALKMEQELSKDEILGLYLNKIFFGNRAYGVAAAAEYYFGKTLDKLTLAEAASLAAIPKFPSSGNPITNPKRALERRNYILERMQVVGFITVAQMRQAQAEPLKASPHEPKVEVQAPYVGEMVRQAMETRYGADALTSGFRVFTTVRSGDQLAAAKAVRDGMLEYDRRHGWRGPEAHVEFAPGDSDSVLRDRLRRSPSVDGLPGAIVAEVDARGARLVLVRQADVMLDAEGSKWTGKTPAQLLKRGDIVRVVVDAEGKAYSLAQIPKAQAALVSLQPEDGALRALVGGFSYSLNKFNRAAQAQRQPGSSFKPFLYAASFERGYTPASIVLDAPVVFKDRVGHVWRPQNENEKFSGPMRLREALVQSRNLVSVRLLDAIGVDFARKYIAQFGFKLESLPPNLSMSLGSASLTPLSIARGYTVFANGGYLVEPWFIAKVLDRNGVVISYTHPRRACRLCPERLAREESTATIVDGFDLSAGGPVRNDKAARQAAADPAFVGPPLLALAPHAIDERTAFLTTSLMRDVVKRGTATRAKVIEREDIGGKTGSSNEFRDAWFSGFGGDLVTTVWVGKDDFTSLGRGELGGRAALPIWISYMQAALKDVPANEFVLAPPNGVVTASIGAGGNLLPDGTPGALTEYFKVEDYERLTTSYLAPEYSDEGEEAFDIF